VKGDAVCCGRWVAKGLFEPVGWTCIGEAIGFEVDHGLLEPGVAVGCS